MKYFDLMGSRHLILNIDGEDVTTRRIGTEKG
jgi:hypothetical protein